MAARLIREATSVILLSSIGKYLVFIGRSGLDI
jgi:hypothetical protein